MPPTQVIGTREVDGETEPVTLYDIWQYDRIIRSAAVARAVGCTQADAYLALYQPQFHMVIELDVPRWKGENLAKRAAEDEWERTVIWADGSSERSPRFEGVGVHVANG